MQAIAGVGSASKGSQGYVSVHGVGDRTDGAGILGFHHRVAMVPRVVPPMGQLREAGQVPRMEIEYGGGARLHSGGAMATGRPDRLSG